ncbi:hypothetical protein ANCCEY_01361 [Ancylostoma ceylanicum]|uniref:Protein kinase domain-containing protein n=1 Tax=Ancylostoma ceylanicum TaxID=53326 RepID=A0A0D6MAD5_9BILA|nr:hypothetical protein ANCCEY_01361 [Ancylostoma ceylanicum]
MVLPPQLPSKLWKHSKIFTGSAIYTETSNQGTIQLGGQKLTNYGRQDDCESWLYMVIEFTKGGLPWRNTTDMAKVGDEKRAARVSVAAGKRLFGG